jgi:hypothetical protein
MHKSVAIANLIQAAIFGAGWHWLKARWGLPADIAMGCAVLQLVAGLSLVLGRERISRWCAVLCLMGVAVLVGQFYSAGEHLTEAYGSDARRMGQAAIHNLWLATPWGVFFPAWQAAHGGLKALVAPLIVLFLPVLLNTGFEEPRQSWPAQAEQEAAAMAAFLLWTGKEADLPRGEGPATVLLTPFEAGKAGPAVRGDGESLAEAVQSALDGLPAPGTDRPALVLDVARVQYASGALVPAGDGGGLSKRSGKSPAVAWRPGKMSNKRVAPFWKLPRPKMGGRSPTRFDSVLAQASGAQPMRGAWTAPPPLTAQTALDAALAGGRMLARHQTAEGKFAYTVAGPSGHIKRKSYNFPRHAGTTWFLARLALRSDDPEIWAATRLGLAYMDENTITMDDGRAYLGDPRRRDGKAWVGTTALAVLAAVAADHATALPWGRFLASSVDEHGQVLGEMKRSEGVHKAQKKNPYGQGQTTLALAALVRAGHEEFRPTLERLAAYMDGDYGPGGVGRLVVLDEHWTCLAALAIKDALGHASGTEICHAYLDKERYKTPDANSRLRPSAGAAGGLAEAVVAGAYLHSDHRDDAIAYGQWFLQNTYKPADAAFLKKPGVLLGGFRDAPYKLDVRMDAVQHIGSALLGIEALMSSVQPGSLP